MSQVGVTVQALPSGDVLVGFSTPENGLEYSIQWDREGYLDMLKAMLNVAWGSDPARGWPMT